MLSLTPSCLCIHNLYSSFHIHRQERELTAALRLQQDEDYQESLRADQEKERKKQQEKEEADRKELEEKQKEEDQQRQKDNIRRLKMEMIDKVTRVS